MYTFLLQYGNVHTYPAILSRRYIARVSVSINFTVSQRFATSYVGHIATSIVLRWTIIAFFLVFSTPPPCIIHWLYIYVAPPLPDFFSLFWQGYRIPLFDVYYCTSVVLLVDQSLCKPLDQLTNTNVHY